MRRDIKAPNSPCDSFSLHQRRDTINCSAASLRKQIPWPEPHTSALMRSHAHKEEEVSVIHGKIPGSLALCRTHLPRSCLTSFMDYDQTCVALLPHYGPTVPPA
jgi:hypothetical protein